MRTRARVTAIPALLASAVVASLPGALRASAHEGHASPEAAGVNPWADLGLPEIALAFTSSEVTGMPESLAAARYLVTITGEPTEEDFYFAPLFLRLPDGMTLEQALAEAGANQVAPPAFYYDAVIAGGPSIVAGKGTTSATGVIDLTPGEWLVAGSVLRQPPVPFTVTGELPDDLPEPESTATLTIGEMTIEQTAGELVAGENLIKIENVGVQPHFVELQKVPDGTTKANIEATLQAEMGGTPEAEVLDFADLSVAGLSADQSGGTTQWVTVTLEAGTHAAMCFIADPESGMPHAMMGMYEVFEIE
ncbi:MAG TPA: hypothetical protein VM450_04960 [Thermomicrobiales bacterium]|nr:hypothetical protein [Thermomicrobiales bacterium]